MGKKYIVEIGRLERLYKVSTSAKGMPNITWLSSKVDLTPYTEPDLEQVRKEAYEEGYKTAKIQCGIQAEKDMREVGKRHYQRGLNDAWDAAKKLWDLKGEMIKAFRKYSVFDILNCYTAAEVIEKLKAHEQEKEQDEFHVGDEFENGAGKKFVVLKMDGKEIDRYIDGDGKTYVMDTKYSGIRKTGRHFPEIAAVLEKMRGESND
jgi:hypothetical protein